MAAGPEGVDGLAGWVMACQLARRQAWSVSLFDLEAVSSSRPALVTRQRAQAGSRVAVAPACQRARRYEGHPLTRSSTLPGSTRSGWRAVRRGRRSLPTGADRGTLVQADAGLDEVRTPRRRCSCTFMMASLIRRRVTRFTMPPPICDLMPKPSYSAV